MSHYEQDVMTLVMATAIDESGTECAYCESVNRRGVTTLDIGEAVTRAIMRLQEKAREIAEKDGVDYENNIQPSMVIVRFSEDT